jgi:hypothetical protein
MSLKQKQIKHLTERMRKLDQTIRAKRVQQRMNEQAQTLSVLLENELEQAEIILAVKHILDRLQKMAESVARMNAEDVLPLVDQMRGIFGIQKSEDFSKAATEAFNVILEAVKQAKDKLGNQILNLEGKPFETVSPDSGVSSKETTVDDVENRDDVVSDNFDVADAASGPDKEPLGREMKEEGFKSVKKVLENHNLAVGKMVAFVDDNGKRHIGKIVRKNSAQDVIVNVNGKPEVVALSKIKGTNESANQKKKLSQHAESASAIDEGNAFAAAVQQAKALGKKPGDKFDVDGKEYTLEDLQRECQYYDQKHMQSQGDSMVKQYQAFADLVKSLEDRGVENATVLAVMLGRKKFGPAFFQNTEIQESVKVKEKAPPGKKAEDFIKNNKESFKKRYGKDWERVLYATAWKQFGESAEFASKAKKLIESYDPLWSWSDEQSFKIHGQKTQKQIAETMKLCPSWQKNQVKAYWNSWLKNTLRLDPGKHAIPGGDDNNG